MIHIIDDEAYVLDIISVMLQRLGNQTMVFSNSEAYLAYVQSEDFQKPKLAFTDINMPYMNGYALMDKVWDIYPDYPFAIVTSDTKIPKQYDSKIQGHLVKPFRMKNLSDVIAKMDCAVQEPCSV
jgi:two-component system LytT family response regulator